MKRSVIEIGLALLVLSLAAPASAGDWKHSVGVTYAAGFQDLVDYHERALGVEVDFAIPIGATYHPYYETDKGHRIGIDVGPVGIILFDTNISDSMTFFSLPVGVTYGYGFARDKSTAPYVRAGVRYNIASGDFVEDSSPGFIGAIGLEMARQKRVSFGLELAYDNATVKLKDEFGFRIPDEEIEAGGFQISFLVIL